MTTSNTLLAVLPGAETVPLALLRGHVGWNRQAQLYAVQAGVIRPLPKRGPHGGYQVTRDDAIQILIAGALAPGAGVAVVTMLRAIQASGISPQALASAVSTAEKQTRL